MDRVLLYQDALAEILAAAAALSPPRLTEEADLLAAEGRILAQPIRAERDQPPFPRATRDGYAVRSLDLEGSGGALRLIGAIRAGEAWGGAPLGMGEALEIMTGAPVPPGADAVLMVEHTHADAHQVVPEAGRRLAAGENIVAAGAEAQRGATLVPAGRRVRTPEISLAASCGQARLTVFAQPRVAIVATGDELVALDAVPAAAQIRDSNSYTLASLVAAEGGSPVRLSPARDTREDLESRLRAAASADLLLFSGGVSMGKYDLVEQVLREAGAEFQFTGALIQPGRPVVFGRLPVESPEEPRRWQPFFGLPGNPISTEVCFRLFVAPLLRALAGAAELPPRFAEAALAEDVRGGSRVTRFLPGLLEGDWTGVRVSLVPWQGSGDLAANGRANCFVVLPREEPTFPAGSRVRVLLR